MTFWLITIGLWAWWNHGMSVLFALNPRYGFDYLLGHGFTGFPHPGSRLPVRDRRRGAVYEHGHFAPRPIRFTVIWLGASQPSH